MLLKGRGGGRGGGGGDCNPSSPLSYPPLFDDLYDKVKFYSGLFD